MKEVWKDVPGYEGIYFASNLGRVRSNRCVLRPSIHRDGYCHVVFCVKGVRKYLSVHRVVALAFIPNPENLPQINHKDENKVNNCVENLEWCTMDYNIHYGTGQIRSRNRGLPSNVKPVTQYSLDGVFIAKYPSTMDAYRKTGVNQANINACAHHKHHQMKGFVWRFDGDPFTPIPPRKKRLGKEIVQMDLAGNVIKVWPSLLLAAQSLGVSHTKCIRACAKGKKPNYKGYIWRYKTY